MAYGDGTFGFGYAENPAMLALEAEMAPPPTATPVLYDVVKAAAKVLFTQVAYQVDDGSDANGGEAEFGCGRCGRAGECRVYNVQYPDPTAWRILCREDALEHLEAALTEGTYDWTCQADIDGGYAKALPDGGVAWRAVGSDQYTVISPPIRTPLS